MGKVIDARDKFEKRRQKVAGKKAIKEYYDRDRDIDALLETTVEVHDDAYQALRDYLRGKGGLEALEDESIHDDAVDVMVKQYITSAKEKLAETRGMEMPENEFEEDIFMQRYLGITRQGLKEFVDKVRSKYTKKQHETIRDKLLERQIAELKPLASAHMDDSHVDAILDYTGADQYVREGHELTLDKVSDFLDTYKNKGEVALSDLEEMVDKKWKTRAHLNEDTKGKLDKLKDKYKDELADAA